MMKIFTVIPALFLTISITGQINNPDYDSTLARRLGADQYGMKMYVLVILKTGNGNVTDKVKRDSLFAGHMQNIRRLAGLKKLVVAGPLEKNDKFYRGIFILDVQTFEEAEALLASDPTIKENIFEAELYNWYGSAALSEYLKFADRIWKINP